MFVEPKLEVSPFDDAMFIFCNKKQDKLKIVYWDKTRFAMWYKVLQKKSFKWPKVDDMSHLRLSEQQLTWLLGGYDVIGHRTLSYQCRLRKTTLC
ncbi:IS66 family insertion sequence element accessory protein TnpB [Glaciecola siphonariae]|uniref:IS66 family insertion sequence element accessory protein TnpB n=1 Tax=Glaciecola siphonariae TaxID=521012 RepID=A0ABV9LZQ7_9ALTE